MQNQLDKTEKWILNSLNSFSESYFNQTNRSSSFVTYSIKDIIGNYGINQGFQVCASGFPDYFHNEWLYDMVWYSENENKNLVSVELVLESEMNYGLPLIKYDFEKLLLSNSKYRIMICCAGKIPIEEIKNYINNAIINYKNLKVNDRILTLIWDDFYSGEFIPYLKVK